MWHHTRQKLSKKEVDGNRERNKQHVKTSYLAILLSTVETAIWNVCVIKDTDKEEPEYLQVPGGPSSAL